MEKKDEEERKEEEKKKKSGLVTWIGIEQRTVSVPDMFRPKLGHRIRKTDTRRRLGTTSADCYPHNNADYHAGLHSKIYNNLVD